VIRPGVRTLAAAGLAAGILIVAISSAAPAPRRAHDVRPDEDYYPGMMDIATGPDGNLWFTEAGGDRVGRVTVKGRFTEFLTEASGGSVPTGITRGPDGNLWFTERAGSRVTRITPAGQITAFTQGVLEGSGPTGIAAGPDGNLWFTERDVSGIGRITPSGAVTEFTGGLTRNSGPWDIAASADGNMWFTEDRDGIGRVTPAGVITEFTAGLTKGSEKGGPALGSDGNMWFTEIAGNRIGRITPAGVISEFSDGLTPESQPWDIALGPDGAMWFTEVAGNRIGRITPAGVITEFARGLSPDAAPAGITAGPDGSMWFTESQGSRVGRITTAGVITEFPPPVRVLSVRPVGDRAVAARVRCPAAACRGTLILTAFSENGATPVGARRFSVGARRAASVVVPLSARGRRLVARAGTLDVAVRIGIIEHSRLGVPPSDFAGVTLWRTRTSPATVTGVVSGDTIRVWTAGRSLTVRLAGVIAPEIAPLSAVDMCFGQAAAGRTRRILPAGTHVTLVTVPHVFAPDRYGRQPAYVFTAGRHGPAGSVNFALVRTGFAAATDEYHPNALAFGRAQERARGERLGMWAPPCNGDLTLPEPAAGTVVSR